MRSAAGVRDDLTGEVGAAGAGGERDALDRKVRVCMEELGQHPLHLHPWRVALELDARRPSTLHEVEDLALELRVSGGGFEVGEQLGHLGSGRGWTSNIATNVSKVKREERFKLPTLVAAILISRTLLQPPT